MAPRWLHELTNERSTPSPPRTNNTGTPNTSSERYECGAATSHEKPNTSGIRRKMRSISSCQRSGSRYVRDGTRITSGASGRVPERVNSITRFALCTNRS